MSKPSKKTLEALRGVRTEIGAGKVMFPKSDADRAWNSCADRATRIISNYLDGEGLFQIATKPKRSKP